MKKNQTEEERQSTQQQLEESEKALENLNFAFEQTVLKNLGFLPVQENM